MARQEQDREDLLKEASALVERAELALAGHSEHVIIGFRRDGCASIYWSADEAYHFNSQAQLRRAYVDGTLLKAERGKLIALVRNRAGGEVQLIRHELDFGDLSRFLGRLVAATSDLREQLAEGACQLIDQVPSHADVPQRMWKWLMSLPSPPYIADRPNAC